jgi:hypothetical protein
MHPLQQAHHNQISQFEHVARKAGLTALADAAKEHADNARKASSAYDSGDAVQQMEATSRMLSSVKHMMDEAKDAAPLPPDVELCGRDTLKTFFSAAAAAC